LRPRSALHLASGKTIKRIRNAGSDKPSKSKTMLHSIPQRTADRPARSTGAPKVSLPSRTSATPFNGTRFQPIHKFTKKLKTALLPLRPVWKIAGPVLKLGRNLSFLAILAASVGAVQGQLYWNTNGTSGNWTDSNWGTSSSGPFTTGYTNGNNAFFTANSSIISRTTTAGNITVSSNVVVNFTNGSGSWGTGGNVRTLDVGIGGILDFANIGWSTSAGTGFVKEGQGIVKLGSGNSGWGGGFTLNNGTAIVSGVNSMGGAAANTLTINGGTLATDATVDLSGKYGGGITIGGNFTIGGVTTGVSSGNGSATAAITFSNNASLGASTRTITIGANGTYTFSGNISTTASAGLTINATSGSTGTIVLSGTNTYTGATTINAGTLSISSVANGGSNSNLGASSINADNLVLGGGTLTYTGSTASTDRNFTLTNGTTSTISVSTSAQTLTLSGTSAPGNGSLTKAGAGTLSLTGASNHSGNTTVSAGTLALGHVYALQNSTLNTGSSGSQAVTFTVAGTNTYNLGGLAGSDALDNGGNSLSVGSNNADTTFSAALSGSGNFTKTGSGTLIFASDNTYSGTTTISSGVLQLGTGGTTGQISTSGNIVNNANLVFNRSDSFSYSGNMSGSGNTTITSGTFRLNGTAGTDRLSGAILINGGTLNYQTANDNQIADTANLTVSSGAVDFAARSEAINALGISGGTITISSGTLTLGAASSFTGGTTTISTTTGRIITAGATTLGNATISYNNASNNSRAIVLGGNIVVNNVATANLTNTIGGVARLDLNDASRTFTIGDNAAMNVDWVVTSATTASGSLVKAGNGSLILNATSLYTGGTTISAGTLTLGHATDTLANSGAVTVSGGVLNLGSNSDTVGQVTLTSGTIAGSGTLTGSSYALQGGTVNANLGTGTINATSGSTTLNGAAASTAVNINSGALALGSAGSLASTATISVASGATLDLTAKSSGYSLGNGATLNGLGTVTTASGQSLFVGTGATIAPGTSSTSGTLTVGGLTFASGGTYAFTMGSAAGTAGTDWDLISVSNNFDISATSASTFTISINGNSGVPTGFSNSNNYSWDILRLNSGIISGFSSDKFLFNNSISGITGEFSISANNTILTLNYAAGSANAVYWNSSSSVWLTASNWSSNATATGAQVAQFGANSNSASSIGINMNSGSTNNGANNQIVGAIEMTSGRTSNLSIINSSTVANGTLTLNGTTISSVNNVVLRSSSSSNLTIESISGANKAMSLALANTENVVVINGSGGITINSTISGVGKNLTLQGTGTGSLTLAGSNTYTGTTTINSGTLRMGANDVFDGSSSILIAGGTLQTATFNDTVNAFTITSGTLAGNGTLTAATYGLQGGTVNANLGTGTITVSSGTTTLSGTAAATTININSGNLTLGGVDRLANTASISMTGGTLNLNNYNESVGSIAGSGSIVLGSATLTTNSSSDTTFSGSISGSGGLTKNGTGTLVLSGSNTYNGTTTINAGTVSAAAANAFVNTGNITLNPGGSLLVTADDAIGTNTGIALNGGTLAFGAGYNGTVGALTLSANSTIDLGTSSNGVLLRFTNINWNNPNALLSIYNWTGNTEYSGTPGGGLDQVVFGNATTPVLSTSQLQQINFYSGTTESSFIANAFQITSGTYNREIIAVPEPETYITGVILLLGFTFYQIRLARHGQGLLSRLTFLRRGKC
jgi:autotransporter-associated beta strand protein